MTRFLVDAQLPPALARWLSSRGHCAEDVLDDGLQTASDVEIWIFARHAGAVIVTKDEDFAQLSIGGGDRPKVVWLRLLNMRTRFLLSTMEALFPDILLALEAGETLVEVV